MTDGPLKLLKVAILIEDGFEQAEMIEPRKALDEGGSSRSIVSPKSKQVRGWKSKEWGDAFRVDVTLDAATPEAFDALLLPGGVLSPDRLRMQPKAEAFAKAFFDKGKPVAAIRHGPWTVIEAGAAKGRRMRSWPSVSSDPKNAGATFVDEEAVIDQNLVTNRSPKDIPAFNREMIKLFTGAGVRREAA